MTDNLLRGRQPDSGRGRHGVARLLYLASSLHLPEPLRRTSQTTSLWTGPVRADASAAYATRETGRCVLCDAFRRQHTPRPFVAADRARMRAAGRRFQR